MPARTGARSRAVGDRGRSSSSSDPGSAIEGFRQKIPFHHQLTDLGMKLRQLGVAVLLARAALLVEYFGHLLDRLTLPGSNLGRVQFVLARQLRDRLVALDRLKRHLALNSAENRLRVLMMVRPLHRRIYLNRLSQEVGPPLIDAAATNHSIQNWILYF
jgi:hypothetical protein